MKKFLVFLPFLLVSLMGYAQIEDPVDWSYKVEQTGADEHELVFSATMEPGWHMYSQFIKEGGPIPTSFNFENISGYELVGKTSESPKPETEFSKIFDMELLYFSDAASFRQKVKRLQEGAQVKGYLEYMVCNDEKCLPPTAVDFELLLNNSQQQGEATDPAPADQPEPEEEQPGQGESPDQAKASTEEAPPTSEIPANEGIFEPVKWSFSHEKIDENTYELKLIAQIEEGWKVYAQDIEDGGPIPTSFTFTEGNYEKVGETEERSQAITKQDEVFEMELSYFKKEAVFSQKVTFSGAPENIKGELVYMTCDEERCLPPTYVDFGFGIAGPLTEAADAAAAGEAEGSAAYKRSQIDRSNPVSECEEVERIESAQGFWGNFLKGIIGGLIALLTPCVFPMIPLTVSFFTKGSTDRRKGIINAVLYGGSITLIYVLISVPFHIMENLDSNILNNIATDPILNFVFFAIFIVFAISFFGYFELTLPSSFVNKVSAKSSGGGLLGIFFMAATLTLVSFSCTGPILGTLLGESIQGANGASNLTAGMLGFGIALGLPFALFAAFPGWLNSLPQSGGWMTTVKVVLGFVELALAIKFLSNADLVLHLGILKRELFFALWILTCLGLAAYLLGFIRFPHDPPKVKRTTPRIAGALASLAFAAYLVPGLFGANLQLLSGFPPPMFYSYAPQETTCPLGLACFKDYEEGMAYARENNKPVMLDFTGWACVNCRRMEENVWVKKEIFDRLDQEYVLISLYVDDRKKLEDPHEVVIPQTGQTKKIRTVGDKWATLQTLTFNNNSQPYYVLLSPDEVLLNPPVGYTPDEGEYQAFLDCGLDAFKQLNQKQLSEK
jgi:thiol:disulfide interchange protein